MFQHAETNHENKLEIAMLFRFLLLLIVGERLEILAFARSAKKKNEKLRSQ